MDISFLRKHGSLLVAAALGALVFFWLYPGITPKASVNLEYSRNEILDKAADFMTARGFDVRKYRQDGWFEFDGNAQLALRIKFGLDSANALLRQNRLPAHLWRVLWYEPSVPRSQALETFELFMTPGGHVVGLKHDVKDTVSGASLTEEEARALAERFLISQGIDLSHYKLKSSSQIKQQNRLDYNFDWTTIDTTIRLGLWLRVQGNEVGGYKQWIQQDASFEATSSRTATNATLLGTVSFATIFLLFFYIIIFFLKKYHDGEVGVKTGLMVFLGLFAVYVLGAVNEFNSVGSNAQMGDLNKFNVRLVIFGLNVLVVYVFLSVMVLAAWSVGESYSRSLWPQKLVGVDSMLFRHFFTLNVADGLLRGYVFGFILLGVFSVIAFLATQYLPTGFYVLSISGTTDGLVPAASAILNGIEAALFGDIVFRLFFLSMLHDKLKKRWLAAIISSLLWGLAMFPMWPIPFGFPQLPIAIAVLVAFGLAFSFIFYKYDLLTAMTANFVLVSLPSAIPIFSSESAYFSSQTILFFLMFAVPIAVAAVGFVRREQFVLKEEFVPEHVKRISERERMAKELEIARRVQMSLLPKASPTAPGYDIAGTCIPALEVGGDYYDFVHLGGRKVGIAIGDVSGKGVPAAIYMTLTKGILQSHAEENISPKAVLSKVNSLMYRTIDRNSFVSMFYAVLDLESRIIRFARAGQCPVILAQRSNEHGSFLTPKGMALGLEVGRVFDSVLEEQELALQSGEVLVFYTDGFTEARNEHGEEFGEERLVASIAQHRTKSAQEIISGICKDVDAFTKGYQQHDDMTMVVVKVA
jgi:hypothetical protein